MTAAATRRAAALAAGDETALRRLMHPGLQWTTFRGEVLGYRWQSLGTTGQWLIIERLRLATIGPRKRK